MNSENIYEFDLNSFFPSVNLEALERLMVEKLKIPKKTASYLIDMHRSITVLPKEKKMSEVNDENVLLNPTNDVNPNLPKELKEKIEEIMKSDKADKLEALQNILPVG